MIQIWDVFLEAGSQYLAWLTPKVGSSNAALFRNPSASAYWAGRSLRVFEIPAADVAYYTAPASDWYGLVVFPIWNLASSESFGVCVEKLNDCIPLSSATCVNNKLYSTATGPANDYTFTQESPWWSVVAVLPDTLDQKAIGLFDACDGVGTQAVAPSPGVGKTQFLISDFNHTPPGQYYMRVQEGSTNLDFSIQWDNGADMFPVPGQIVEYTSGLDPTSVCVKVWDVHLEAGKQYEFFFYHWGEKHLRLALFRSPGTGPYWAARGGSEWEMSAEYGFRNYTAPVTDYYGLVVFADRRKEHASQCVIQIQPLDDCEALTGGVCVERSGWPRDFAFTQSENYWTAVAMIASAGDLKSLEVHPQCDGQGDILAYSATNGMNLVVGDFNHNTMDTYYPTVANNDNYAPYTVAWDTGQDQFPFNSVVQGTVGGTSGDCGLVRIWDLLLSAGQTYQIGFTRGGPADVRLALFRNPGGGTYWAGRGQAAWEYAESGTYTYTAPATDWYGLVVFPNKRGAIGNYSIRISNTSATGIDPEPFVPDRFALYQNVPNPFNPSTTIRYDVPAGGGQVSLVIYDVNGRLVRTLVDRMNDAGAKSIVWDGKDEKGVPVSSGVYFYRLVGPGFGETRKMAVMK
jgi:hypothetical protein